MITLRNQLDVNRPVAEVFDFIANVEGVPKWQPAVIESRRLSEGPLHIGSQFRETAKFMGRQISTICEITELEPMRRIAWRGTSSGPASYSAAYDLEADGTSTRITIHGTFEFKGLWKLLEPFIGAEVRKESQGELKAMKAAIEARK